MNRVKKIVSLVVFVPLAIVLIVLCVANRQVVTLALNPFEPQDTVLALSGPFFVFLFLAVIFGMLLGSIATWIAQGKYRRQARIEAREALKRHQGMPAGSPAQASARTSSSLTLPPAKG
ncbi:putative integral membrane protein [Neorhizobium galegae]|uniref:DUF1049 domain-containing protein n=1 Tax=Neorhizobium galegae TaxID=399 RepID=UPI001FD8D3F9|nr:DUF1049 domain-containing protein [Neorhizobium galegae]MBP2548252.1 putative integral membrane protein [Neorhizobium galegae]